MITVEYPEPKFRMKQEGGRRFIFCIIRKQWLVLTEEEWVRQNFVNYLISHLHYPSTLIALEKEIQLHELTKRFDVLVYDQHHKPWMLIECKEPAVALNENILQQVLRYNISVPAIYIVLTNGNQTLAWKKEETGLQLLNGLPEWNNLQ